MAVPNTIFIDTCVIEDEGYRFDSDKMRAFIDAAKEKKVTILLPDPTQREILRHIKENAEGVVSALQEAKRKAPFLKKWKEWPIKRDTHSLMYELHRMAQTEWEDFLLNFKVVRLGYEDIKLPEIMDWYDKQISPFGPGKNKEFPDALSFGLILQYARKTKCSVAVLSRDKDFYKATERYQEVLPFESIAAFTQTLIQSDERVKIIQQMVEKDKGLLEKAIAEEFPSLSFYPSECEVGDVSDVEVEEVSVKDFMVIAVGDKHCTLAVNSIVSYSAYLDYEIVDEIAEGDYWREITVHKQGFVDDEAYITGVVKLHIAENWEAIGGVDLVALDNDDIEVVSEPRVERDYEDYEE